MYISQLKLINNLLSSSWWHALLFGIFIDCVIILSIRETSFLVSSRIFFEAAFVIFSEILFQTKSCFMALFEAVLSASVVDVFVLSRSFFSILTAQTFIHVFCKEWKSRAFDINLISGVSWISYYVPSSLITKVKFTLSSISRCTEFWSVNHTSAYENSEWNISQ